ncbi:sodium-dependent transporter [Paenibacillus tarimensis]|uniref:sodium-dependent transporter n=1 Tax=Paenibacillus tarimensis TaxID=416012 RepID=UPI001F1ECEC0|nr:sodium-dependent transporter [Paenibacillus tarimensis]MCF2945252.1 sodium-dependent transporter [Paenibacillus tarimensis]
MKQRDQWASRTGFILAAAGSAIGLGNIWRFPYVVYGNGGGAFLIPYFFALLTAGIPILLLEFGIGRKGGGSAPYSLSRLSRKFEWLGWWQALICFVITTYYVAIVAWAVSYFFYSFNLNWGTDTEGFLFGSYLGVPEGVVTDSGWNFGGIQWHILLPLVAVWAGVYYVLSKGVQRGIERVSKIFMPILLVIMVLFVIRAVTLPGAAVGLDHLFTPDFGKILPGFLGGTNPEWYTVWMAAYGQIFFSLSIAFAIMITYSSYIDKQQDVNNSGFIMAFSNSGFEFLAAIGVFAAIGFMATTTGVDVSEVAKAGLGLAFVVFPQIINAFPILNGTFGALFFLSLVIAGFTSLISIIEVLIAAIRDKFNLSRQASVNWVVGVCALVSLAYTTGAGVVLLDIVDHYINNFGIVIAGLFEVILIGWFTRLATIREENNLVSDFRIGRWWDVMIKVVTPLILIYMSYRNFEQWLNTPYEGYPLHAQLTFGWIMVALTIVLAFVLAYAFRWKEPNKQGGR